MGTITDDLSKETLYNLYIKDKMTEREIAKLYDVSRGIIRKKLKLNNITFEMQQSDYRITDIQNDLILGGILGDATFARDVENYRMTFKQAENQKDYLQNKLEIMKPLCKKKEMSISLGNQKASKNSQAMYYFHTRTLPLFNKYKSMNIVEVLNKMNNNILSIWLMDDGSLRKYKNNFSPYYQLSITRFNHEEAKTAIEVLNNKLGLNASLMKYNRTIRHKKYYYAYIYFPTNQTHKVVNTILNSDFGEFIKETMSYKLP